MVRVGAGSRRGLAEGAGGRGAGPDRAGGPHDPACWVTWGDEPATRRGLLAPTAGGLVTLAIRVHTPQEGPRASGKLIRWSRVQVGDFAVEMQGGHRFVSASLEGVILRGMDAEAHRIGAKAG